MTRHLRLLVFLFAGAVGAPVAAAQPGGVVGPRPTVPSEDGEMVESYKRSIVVADSVSGVLIATATLAGLVCIGNDGDSEGGNAAPEACLLGAITALGGLGIYALAPPVIHGRKGNSEAAAVSLLLRVGLPAAGVALLKKSNSGVGVLAIYGGAATAMAIDWLVLAKLERPASSPIVPSVTPTEGGVSIGLGGSF